MRVVLLAWLLGACIEVDGVICADGRVCQPGWTCDDTEHWCIPPGCGDGTRSGDEACDTVIGGELDCRSYDFYVAEGLSCNSRCEIDARGCSERCGDEAINGREVCDGIPPAARTCLDYGQDLGRVECPACAPELLSCGPLGWRPMAITTSVELRGIWGSSPDDLYAVGSAGVIVHSSGEAWLPMASPTTANLYGIWGSAANDIYAVGDGVILHYDGNGWTAQAVAANLRGVWGSSANDIVAVGHTTGGTDRDGPAVVVRGGGTQWTTTMPVLTTMGELRGVWGTSASNIYAVGRYGSILHFDGSMWAQIAWPVAATERDLYAIWGTDANHFVIAGGGTIGSNQTTNGVIVEYNNGAWSAQTNPRAYYSVWGSSLDDIHVGGFIGELVHRDTLTWRPQEARAVRSVLGLWGIAGRTFAVTQGGVVLESRGTATFRERPDAGVAALRSVRTFADGTIVAVGNPTGLTMGARCSRALGAAWSCSIDSDGQYWGTWGNSSSDLWLVSQYDGGGSPPANLGLQRWQAPSITSISPSANLRAIWGPSADELYVVGLAGVIGHYTAGALTIVRAADPGNNEALNGVWGRDANDVFAVGDGGEILRRTNGTWAPIASPTTHRLNGIWGPDASEVFAVGNAGTIIRFDGTAWAVMESGAGDNLIAVHGTSGHDVFAVGSAGAVLHFDGVAWSKLRLDTTSNLMGAWIEPRTAWFVTEVGEVIRLDRTKLPSETHCFDGFDADDDGRVDCADDDCAAACGSGGTCKLVGDLACGDDIAGTTYTGIARIAHLDCRDAPYGGPEAAYRFVATTSGPVTLELRDASGLGVSVLAALAWGGCDTSSCEAAGAGGTTFTATAGETYVVVIDGPRDMASTFSLAVTCAP